MFYGAKTFVYPWASGNMSSYIFQNFMVLAFKGTKTWLILFIYIAFNIFYSLLRLTVCYCMLCTNVFHRKK